MAEARPAATAAAAAVDGETESTFSEKFLLDDLDSYWDELQSRLTVSRMVSNSVIKATVNAVSEDAADKIAAKEAEIALLNEMLLVPDLNSACSYSGELARLRSAVDEKVRRVEESLEAARIDELRSVISTTFDRINSMFVSIPFEQQLKCDVEREVVSIAIQNSIRVLCKESDAKLCKQRRDFNALYLNWEKKMAELRAVREELDAIYKSVSSEPGSLSSHFEIFQEHSAAKVRDNLPRSLSGSHQALCVARSEENEKSLMDKSGDSPKFVTDLANSIHLKHMTKEEVMWYYNTEVMKMRRQYDQALSEKTEELFKFKREFLKEKGSSHFRKDREFETLRRKIPEVILKLDNVLLEKDNSPVIDDNCDEQLISLNDKIDELLVKNQHLRGCLRDKRKEVACLASQISDASSQRSLSSSTEQEIMSLSTLIEEKEKAFLSEVEENKKLKQEIMPLSTLIEEKEKAFLSELEENRKLKQEVISLSTLVEEKEKEFIFELEENRKLKQEIISLSTLVEEKEKEFIFELEENRKLKQEVMSLSTLMKEKEKFASEAGAALVQQKDHFDLINKELSILREQVYKLEILISDRNNELDLVNCKLNEAMEQVCQSEISLNVLNQRFKIASDSLDEADEENTMLRDSIEEMQTKLAAFVARDKERVKQMENINNSMEEFLKAVADLENKLVDKIQRYRYRLETLSHQCTSLTEQVSQLREKEMWYTKILELKSSNLQKAETEVDLLGDEVDVLLSLLGKIYIALDHYSPVFELYPGVMDILKLVQKELEGGTIRSV